MPLKRSISLCTRSRPKARHHARVRRVAQTVRRALLGLLLHRFAEQSLELGAIVVEQRLGQIGQIAFHLLQELLDLLEHLLKLFR